MHNLNNNNYNTNNNNNNNLNVSGNYGRIMIPTNENHRSNNYNLHTLSDANSNFNNNNSIRFNLNKKNAVGSRLNTVSHDDESVEEFSKDLENPNRKDSLIMKYIKKKKLTL